MSMALAIFRKAVLDNRPLPLKQLRELLAGEKYTDEMARDDVQALRSVGCLVKLERCPRKGREKQFVFLDGPHTDDDAIRETMNKEEKTLAARLAASVICGLAECKDKQFLPLWMKSRQARQALDRMFSQLPPGGKT